MTDINQQHVLILYSMFSSAITSLDCGEKCSVYNEKHVPFCCDTHHVIPSSYIQEWEYLRQHTDLWRLYSQDDQTFLAQLSAKLPDDQVLIECQGYQKCQRAFRAITCRSFPFFPYIDRQGAFIGFTYYWDFEDRCWLVNHLDMILPSYRDEFIHAYDFIFSKSHQEYMNFRHQSIIMRRVFGRKKRAIPLISRTASSQIQFYKISPKNGRMRKVDAHSFAKHSNYFFADKLPFTEEEE
jgi:hypothetical protein